VARKKKPPEHANHERWLVSYADFITLLFAFFTTLYAISTVDAQKMGKMVTSMRASFDSSTFPSGSDKLALSPGTHAAPASGPNLVENLSAKELSDSIKPSLKGLKPSRAPREDGAGNSKKLAALKKNIEAMVGTAALGTRVRTRMEGRGLIISLGEAGLFDSASETLKPGGRALLDTIASGLAKAPNYMRVEGHTDNVPINTARFPSNWDLSTSRATALVTYLVSRFGITPGRLSAAGYAEFRPVAPNDTAEGRALNRRVDIVVLNPESSQLEP
jgi:chemotaxis protein MotB